VNRESPAALQEIIVMLYPKRGRQKDTATPPRRVENKYFLPAIWKTIPGDFIHAAFEDFKKQVAVLEPRDLRPSAEKKSIGRHCDSLLLSPFPTF
jgi:hypothetical protein